MVLYLESLEVYSKQVGPRYWIVATSALQTTFSSCIRLTNWAKNLPEGGRELEQEVPEKGELLDRGIQKYER